MPTHSVPSAATPPRVPKTFWDELDVVYGGIENVPVPSVLLGMEGSRNDLLMMAVDFYKAFHAIVGTAHKTGVARKL